MCSGLFVCCKKNPDWINYNNLPHPHPGKSPIVSVTAAKSWGEGEGSVFVQISMVQISQSGVINKRNGLF